MITWQTDSEFIGANCAEHAMVGDYELVVFDLPADRAGAAVIGWELFGPQSFKLIKGRDLAHQRSATRPIVSGVARRKAGTQL